MEPHSEASKLLEAALEQMDGIIQGAKYEIPNYADFQQAPTNNANANAALAHSSNGAGAASPGQTNGNGVSGQGKNPRAPVSSGRVGAGSLLSEALRSLRTAILDAGEDDLAHLATEADEETVRFLARWLQNNPGPGGARAHSRGGGGVDGDVLFELEERLARAEADRDSSAMRADMATEQLDRQGARLVDLEQLLQAKKELLRKTDQALERERASRRALEEENEHRRSTSPHFSEVARLRARCSELEAENQELRAICGGNRTPKYLPISPGARPRDLSSPQQQGRSRRSPMATEDSSPEEPSPRKGQLVDHDLPPPSAADTSVDVSSPSSGRPARGFKKIFGKIKRSNSGGHLEDKKRGGMTHQPDTPEEFRRGGFRATAGGRLGHRDPRRTNGSSSSVERPSAALAAAKTSRPVSEWSVDTVCTWLECLGLGAYCPEVKKSVGTGAQLAAMSFGDLEHKLNVRHYLHRKKLFLALQARQQQQDGRHDPEGQLDFHWVMRWLDDVGLPQYKDAFVEARVDGRVLNVLTTEDLFLMKVTNLLHHMSLRRGIQVRTHNAIIEKSVQTKCWFPFLADLARQPLRA